MGNFTIKYSAIVLTNEMQLTESNTHEESKVLGHLRDHHNFRPHNAVHGKEAGESNKKDEQRRHVESMSHVHSF